MAEGSRAGMIATIEIENPDGPIELNVRRACFWGFEQPTRGQDGGTKKGTSLG